MSLLLLLSECFLLFLCLSISVAPLENTNRCPYLVGTTSTMRASVSAIHVSADSHFATLDLSLTSTVPLSTQLSASASGGWQLPTHLFADDGSPRNNVVSVIVPKGACVRRFVAVNSAHPSQVTFQASAPNAHQTNISIPYVRISRDNAMTAAHKVDWVLVTIKDATKKTIMEQYIPISIRKDHILTPQGALESAIASDISLSMFIFSCQAFGLIISIPISVTQIPLNVHRCCNIGI